MWLPYESRKYVPLVLKLLFRTRLMSLHKNGRRAVPNYSLTHSESYLLPH